MLFTVASAVEQVRLKYPRLPQDRCVQLLNIIHEEILHEIPVMLSREVLALTANTRELDLPESYLKIWQCYTYNTSTQTIVKRLRPTSVTNLDVSYPEWEMTVGDASGPVFWYHWADAQGGGRIGIYPTAATSFLTIADAIYFRVTRRWAALDISGYLPEVALSPRIYIYGAMALAANMYDADPTEHMRLQALYEQEMARNRAAYEARAARSSLLESPPPTIYKE